MNDVRSLYLADAVATATPQRLLVMLYDRLLLDIDRAAEALRTGSRPAASKELVHAQAIVSELSATLRTDVGWDSAEALAALYAYMLSGLIEANLTGNEAKLAEVRGLVEPLRDSWAAAALELATSSSSLHADVVA